MRPDIVDVPQIPATTGHTGSCRALVILVDFQDKPADRDGHGTHYFGDLLFEDVRTSMRGYFVENSYGRFLIDGDVYGWFKSDCRHSDFVNRDKTPWTADDHGLDISASALDPETCDVPLNVWGLVKQAVLLADESLDFSEYDNDGPDGLPDSGDDDGFVDALFIVHSGPGAEIFGGSSLGVDYVWSMQSNLDYYVPTKDTVVDGIRIGAFVIVPEFGEIGVFAHEFCHLLGLPDLYNSETGLPVVGQFCLMDEGAWNGPMGRAGSVP
jgi:M6 family metalloprotease-like protein